MAKFFDDFTGYTNGSTFTNNGTWQQRITTASQTNSFQTVAGAQHGRTMRIVGATTSGSRVLSYNPAGTAANADILAQFQSGTANSTTGGRFGMAYVRYSGTTEATTKGYVFYMGTFAGARGVGIVEDSTGVTVSSANFSVNANTWYWVRLQATGTTIRAKIWTGAATAEPGSWTVTGTNSTQTTAAYHGVGTFNTGTVNWGWFSIGTGGDTPPVPIDDVSKTQLGNVRIEQTTDRDQLGNVRVTQTTDQDQVGNVAIIASATKDQVGNVRIQRTETRDQIGNVRVQRTETRDQVGSVWIAVEYFKHQVGNVRIVKGRDYRVKPVVQIESEKPQVGSRTTKAVGMAESITGIGASEQIKPVLMIESFDTDYVDTTVLTDDPVALADDPFALAGNLIEVGSKPDALRVVVEKGNIELEKEEPEIWQISQPQTQTSLTSMETKPSPQITTQRVTIKSIEKLKPSLNE